MFRGSLFGHGKAIIGEDGDMEGIPCLAGKFHQPGPCFMYGVYKVDYILSNM